MIMRTNNHPVFLTGLAAGLCYGSWAIYANYEHGPHAWVVAGIIQATYAFFSTLSITHVARWTFVKYKCGVRGVLAGFIVSFIVMLAIPLSVHTLFATPDLWQTILPGLIWGSIYLLGLLTTFHTTSHSAPSKY